MKNMSKIKKGLNLLTCALVALVIALSCMSFTTAYAATATTPTDYSTITVTDGQFPSTSSSVVKLASNWDSGYKGDFGGDVISGIVNLSASADIDEDFMEKTKLDSYSEYANARPETPFGRNTDNKNGKWYFPGTNSNVLMINTNSSSAIGTAYGYSSQAIELSAYSFYKFSAWVKTGVFVQDRGAVIKLSGFDYDIGFWNIDNHTEIDNGMFGFTEYVIYVATADNTVSTTVNLQVGDCYTYGEIGEEGYIEHITPSNGYAFFDNVTCVKLSANAFYEETDGIGSSENVIVKDFNSDVGVKSSQVLKANGSSDEIGSFASGLNGWTKIFKSDVDSGHALYVGTYDAGKSFDENNDYGLTDNPYTPYGNLDLLSDRNILVMSATSDANVGVESGEFTIERNKFYRVSVWANSQNFNDDSNASLVITGESNIASDEYVLNPVDIDSVAGSGDIDARYGWKKYYFYVRGSVVKDCNVKLQLWLGYDGNCTGTVLFDDVRLEEVSYSFFNNNSTAGTVVSFDSTPSTTVDNGRFFEAENYGDEYPLVPVQWTEIGNRTENSVSGVILTDAEHYSANFVKYLNVPNPVSQATNEYYNSTRYPSMLLLASNELSYFGYTSSSITLASDDDYKLSVTLRAIGMEGSGANLWIDVNGVAVASVKNIKSTSGFKTYEFYLQGDKAFEDGTGIDYTATVNIALGNKSQKASGSIYVAEVALETLSDGDFDTKYAQFKTERNTDLSYDMYSFSSFDFFAYDATDSNAIKKSNNWSLIESAEQAEGNFEYGVFDPNAKLNNVGNSYIPAEITKAYNNLENKFDSVYTIQTRNTAAVTQLINPVKLEANSYYMLSVSMAVIINDTENQSADPYGAALYLSGDDNYSKVKFEKVLTTDSLTNKYEFRTYQFYIASGETASTLYLRAALGDIAYPNRYVSGQLYIAYVGLVDLGSSDEEIEETATLKIIDNHVDAEESDETEDEVTDTTESDTEKWWLIPSILFGVAIILAIVGSIIRSAIEKASRRKVKAQLSSYDRRYGYPESMSNENSFDDDKESSNVVIEQEPEQVNPTSEIDKFNDDDAPATKKAEVKNEEVITPEPIAQSEPKQRNDFDD